MNFQIYIILFSFFLIFPSPSVFSEIHENQLKKHLSKYLEVRGQFEQTKIIKKMNLNIKSKGQFTWRKKGELTWQQESPLKSYIIIKKESILQKLEDFPEEVLTSVSHPFVFMFSRTLLSLFSGDDNNVKKMFQVQISGNLKKWSMTLTPNDKMLKKAIQKMTIQGQRYIQHIEILDKLGNITKIRFKNTNGTQSSKDHKSEI